eukprot:15474183-Alexandrium_andersonii.AAC.1
MPGRGRLAAWALRPGPTSGGLLLAAAMGPARHCKRPRSPPDARLSPQMLAPRGNPGSIGRGQSRVGQPPALPARGGLPIDRRIERAQP